MNHTLTDTERNEMTTTAAVTIAQDIADGKYNDAQINMILAGVNEYRRRKGFVAKAAFKVGDKVEFVHRANGLTVVGIVQKIMPKNIKVLQTNGRTLNWVVSPSLLKKVA